MNPDRRQWFGRRAIEWVLDEAGDIPPTLVATLLGLARHAQNDGTGAAPSVETLMAYTRKSRRQVKYDLDKLRDLKLVKESDDQSRVAHIRADRRPTVYELAIPRDAATGGNPLHPDGEPRGATDCTSQLPRGAMGGSTGCNTASNGVQPIAPEENYEKNLEKNNPSLSPDRPSAPAPRTAWPTNRERGNGSSTSTPKTQQTLPQRLVAKHGVPEDKVDYVIECVESMYSVEGDGWWIAADRNDTLPARIAEGLESWEAYTYATTRADAYEEAKKAPACDHGQPGGTATNPDTGLSWLCPLCRRQADPRERAGSGAFWNN